MGIAALNPTYVLWANLSLRHGDRNSEYGQLLRRSAMLGVTWFVW